jgi:transcriptional regulator with XRE-family HTH domain
MKALITPINNLESLATELKATRRFLKISQSELAERCLLSRRTITNAETAHNVGLAEFCRMANALGYELVLRPQQTVVFEELANVFADEDD